MKKVSLKLSSILLAGGLLLLTSCGEDSSTTEVRTSENTKQEASSTLDEESSKKDELSSILNSYFNLSENLANDSAIDAAKSSEDLRIALTSFQVSNLTEGDEKTVEEILESSIEHAEHITDNAGDIYHQREHLVLLSQDIKDLVEIVGSDQKLYEAFCPMANNDKGAIWITNKNVVENPYMGQSMPKCGKINGEIN